MLGLRSFTAWIVVAAQVLMPTAHAESSDRVACNPEDIRISNENKSYLDFCLRDLGPSCGVWLKTAAMGASGLATGYSAGAASRGAYDRHTLSQPEIMAAIEKFKKAPIANALQASGQAAYNQALNAAARETHMQSIANRRPPPAPNDHTRVNAALTSAAELLTEMQRGAFANMTEEEFRRRLANKLRNPEQAKWFFDQIKGNKGFTVENGNITFRRDIMNFTTTELTKSLMRPRGQQYFPRVKPFSQHGATLLSNISMPYEAFVKEFPVANQQINLDMMKTYMEAITPEQAMKWNRLDPAEKAKIMTQIHDKWVTSDVRNGYSQQMQNFINERGIQAYYAVIENRAPVPAGLQAEIDRARGQGNHTSFEKLPDWVKELDGHVGRGLATEAVRDRRFLRHPNEYERAVAGRRVAGGLLGLLAFGATGAALASSDVPTREENTARACQSLTQYWQGAPAAINQIAGQPVAAGRGVDQAQ